MTVYLALDWGTTHHEVLFLQADQTVLAQLRVAHSLAGLQQLDQTRQRLGVAAGACLVGIETAHHLLIDWLWAHDYQQVYLIPPAVTRTARQLYRQSGAKSDRSDALLLANLLRTDLARLHPWQPDSALTQQLRAQVRFLRFVRRSRMRAANRLHALLLRYYPHALSVFSSPTTQIALHFVAAFPSPATAAALTRAQFEAWAGTHGYTRRDHLTAAFARLQAPQVPAAAATVAAYQHESRWLAGHLLALVQQEAASQRTLSGLFAQHPDQAIFASLPGAGVYLAPALLAHFGDDRARFPTAASLQALAGTSPVTRQSGKRRTVHFRRACDRAFRQVAQQWALSSLERSVWACSYHQALRARGIAPNHALRAVANRWLAIAWHLWQHQTPYDEAFHLQQRRQRQRSGRDAG
jgi:transposase